ncbi:PREDICTED: uncharacterized protein LOC109335456 [Lupinus angustifolius]|uniref:uncharacterized protein LOC109335456 n=1 Tax=Lupinus angustifolius TaxID=3871 RepID=UPI00092FD7F5|nr:PREDICTED: uncharacterized protein LOC109335456 [Lupinus angustifolius]
MESSVEADKLGWCSKGLPRACRGGAIFRDGQGGCVGCFASYFNIQDSLYAGVLAAIIVVQVTYSKGWYLIWLECDSTSVVEIFMGSKPVPWKLSNLMNKCMNTMLDMQVKVSHIFREGNACADKLANFAVNSRSDSWWNYPPSFIYHEFNRNLLLLPNYRFRSL